jgi:hypothetical protein
MSRSVNLLSKSSGLWLERQYQFQWWIRTWVLVVLFLGTVTAVIQQLKHQDNQELQLALESVVEVRQAAHQLDALQARVEKYRKSVELADGLEQRDLPLSLLQTVGECCQLLESSLQLKSLKLTEVPVNQSTRQATNTETKPGNEISKVGRFGQQLLLSGSSSPEACSALVAALKQSNAFDTVELFSTEVVSEQSLLLQLFQIRCERQ